MSIYSCDNLVTINIIDVNLCGLVMMLLQWTLSLLAELWGLWRHQASGQATQQMSLGFLINKQWLMFLHSMKADTNTTY